MALTGANCSTITIHPTMTCARPRAFRKRIIVANAHADLIVDKSSAKRTTPKMNSWHQALLGNSCCSHEFSLFLLKCMEINGEAMTSPTSTVTDERPTNPSVVSTGKAADLTPTAAMKLFVVLLSVLSVAKTVYGECPRPTGGEHMLLITSVTFPAPEGTSVKFTCDVGYTTLGSGTVTCTNGQWSSLQMRCKIKTCGAYEEVLNGRVDYSKGVDFGASISIICDYGFYPVGGDQTVTCLVDGWEGRLPNCELITCDPPKDIANGYFDPRNDEYMHSSVVTYSCDKPYILKGSKILVCSDNREFTPEPPTCVLVQCSTPAVEFGIIASGSRPPYKHQSSVTLRCLQGYDMKGSDSVKCNIDSQWVPALPTCIRFTPVLGEAVVEVVDGVENVTLPGEMNLTETATYVEWTRGNRIVHIRDRDGDDPEKQDPLFTNRTQMMDKDPLQNGNMSLILKKPTLKDSGNYICVAKKNTNEVGRIAVVLKVKGSRPVLVVEVGVESVTLTGKIKLTEKATYVKWTRENEIVHIRDRDVDSFEKQNLLFRDRTQMMDEDVLQSGDMRLILKKPTLTDEGVYKCVVMKNDKEVGNIIVTLWVKGETVTVTETEHTTVSLPFPWRPFSSEVQVKWTHGSEEVHLLNNSKPDFSAQSSEFKDRTEMKPDALQRGDLGLILKNPTLSDSGFYICVVTEGSTELARTQVELEVKETLTVDPDSDQFFSQEDIKLSCESEWRVKRTRTGSDQVQSCGRTGGGFGKIGSDNSTCLLYNSSLSDSGLYWCESVTGGRSPQRLLTVTDRNLILDSPALPVQTGSDITLRCRIRPRSGLSPVLLKDGAVVQNKSEWSFTVSKEHEGEYICKDTTEESEKRRLQVTGITEERGGVRGEGRSQRRGEESEERGGVRGEGRSQRRGSSAVSPPGPGDDLVSSSQVVMFAVGGVVLLGLVLGLARFFYKRKQAQGTDPGAADVTYADVTVRRTAAAAAPRSERREEETVYSGVRTQPKGPAEVTYGEVTIKPNDRKKKRQRREDLNAPPSDHREEETVYSGVRTQPKGSALSLY
ncbi:hypothetical protein WMY93_002456 [Mugilogobius chulae]|uniref:Uncharacterized protein n=1 Tax=Mugilogobius chulae TaxID=88201 RepID=A0AAW0PUF7_9GOBI